MCFCAFTARTVSPVGPLLPRLSKWGKQIKGVLACLFLVDHPRAAMRIFLWLTSCSDLPAANPSRNWISITVCWCAACRKLYNINALIVSLAPHDSYLWAHKDHEYPLMLMAEDTNDSFSLKSLRENGSCFSSCKQIREVMCWRSKRSSNTHV